ncbi:phosphocholine-specific phospholipase C [Cupriavidus plantarum]|uniref:phospholipase C n=1 Tax=Cupriavidus plantarum TaxID=942865 RepID=A0A316EPU6_9BURK|nr:phospholipase C, phosphocholine-specific [Cupriavidus plantarum]PWK33337.1 phospholipase C [Cupriavidus plantarum]
MTFNPSKRNFLRNTLGTAAAAATLASFPPSIRRALAIEANNATGTIQDVQHVVLLMLENRAFDSYFGTFRGVRGYGDRFGIPLANGKNVLYQTDSTGNIITPYRLDATQGNAQRAGGTPHTWPDAQAAWDHGRMNRWPVAKNRLSMSYYETAEIPFQRALADAFTLCDAYHCSMHTGTIPNRLFYWTGTNGPSGDNVAAMVNEFNGGNDVGPSTQGWTWKTYADRLVDAGVSWKVYQSLADNYGCNEMMSFRHWRAAMEAMPAARRPVALPDVSPAYDPAIDDALSPLARGFGNTMPDGFLQALRDDVQNGTLPSVSWIIAPSTYSEHPGPSSPAQGGWYVQQVLDALTANPEVWSKTVLLINYDENDGFFDHLPPPSAPSRNADGTLAGGSTLSDADMAFEYFNYTPATANQLTMDGKPFGPGPRVPMWVVSPWSRGGWVNSQTFDHTSTLLFLEKRFGVREPQIGAYRRAVCGDLTSAFNFVNPNSEKLPTLSGRTTKVAVDNLAIAQKALPAIPVPTTGVAPKQETGTRPSRALPYELHTTSRVDAAGTVTLSFANTSTGNAAAVFHVYDKLHLDAMPRRYVVEAGKTFEGVWNVAADGGKYDLWVLGPNGYHRQFTGNVGEQASAGGVEIQVCYELCDPPALQVKLYNRGTQPATFTATAQAYRNDGPSTQTVQPGRVGELRWTLGDSGNWYDFAIVCDTQASFRRRVAGRVETGKDSVSDPAMGQA